MKHDLVVRLSPIDGLGAFASRAFTRGAIIGTLRGRRTSARELGRRFLYGARRVSCDPLQVDARAYLVLHPKYNAINHSCSPNAAIRGQRMLVAIRDISCGDEITFDYSASEWSAEDYLHYDCDEWPMRCSCGEPECRKIIACFPCLASGLRKRYIATRLLQDHIRRRLGRINGGIRIKEARCRVCDAILRQERLRAFRIDHGRHLSAGAAAGKEPLR